MARRNLSQLAYQAIRIEGGLIPADELSRLTTLQSPDKTEQTENHYRIPKGLKLRDEIARYWKIGQNLWADFQQLRQRQDVNAHDVSVREFMVPLLKDVLGFSDIAPSAGIEASGHSYNIGYTACAGRMPLVLAAYNQGLDTPAERFGELNTETGKIRRRSPFVLAQEALNASEDSLWAMVCNGLTLRILRDNPSLTRPAYVEVDLEAVFAEELYADFTAFWLLAHASRFGKVATDAGDCPWERWRTAGQEAGVVIRSNLRYQVAEALRALGTGFLSHPENDALRAALQQHDGTTALTKQAFFEELLRLVYRLIFLATVEDRTDAVTGLRLIFSPNTAKDIQQRYLAGYSLTWLRERAARRSSHDTYSDLWQALLITFEGLSRGEPALGLPALGGLFEGDQCSHIASAYIENRWLLAAVFQLGFFRNATGLTRVNYRDMGPEELGSVYESLLELVPDIQSLGHPSNAKLFFVGDEDSTASTKGNTRKLTGSYYTPDSLVQELIKSALEPVIFETVRAHPERPVDALLELSICDPACGSGHFLLAGARRLADELAKLRASGGSPTQSDYRHALRDVVSHCIFGVDKNPMAIALAKTALWLEAYTPDLPLSFLDHHLQVGDALLGVLDPKVLDGGIPDDAFVVLSGDDKDTASALKKQNKADLKSWKSITAGDMFTKIGLAAQADAVDHLADDTLAGIAAKRNAYGRALTQAQTSVLARLADTYVAAFLAPKLPAEAQRIPLSGYLWGLSMGQEIKPDVDEAAQAICKQHCVFHWWLAFPQVAAKGGFSVMLGNPPWERIKLQEEEFFATRSPLVATAKNKAERGKRIELLRQGLLLHTLYPDVEAAEGLSPPNRAEMRLHEEFINARRGAEAASLFAHASRRYPLMGVGDVNTYALFAETFLQLLSPSGRAGFISPTGIATDDTTKGYFSELVNSQRLASLLSFYEVRRWFPATDDRKPFCLFTIGTTNSARFMYDIESMYDLGRPEKWYELTKADFERLNPNTRTLPIFRSQCDADLSKKLYLAAPVLIAEIPKDSNGRESSNVNPWGIHFSTMFHMSNDSGLFLDDAVPSDGARRLPLYEAKMIHQFDHRWATYVDAPDKPEGLDTEDCTVAQKAEAAFAVRPRYWVDERQVLARIARVPNRVATAWLATHAAGAYIPLEDQKTLEFAVASWVAGELFRRAAGEPGADKSWSDKVLVQAYQTAANQLELRFEDLARTLRGVGIEGKKALGEFARWARLDGDVRLGDNELADVDDWRHRWHGLSSDGTRVQVLLDKVDGWMEARSPRWLIGWRDICRSTDYRTLISSVIPRVGVGDKFLLLSSTASAPHVAALLGCLNSLTCDYIARQKVGGTALKYFTMKQLAVLPPDRYTESDLAFIVPRVLELTYTADDLRPWAEDLGYFGPPFGWDPDRRAQLRAELDAYYARLYGLTREEQRFVLDPADVMGADYPSETFRVMKTNEMRAYGEYRTRRLILDAWDRLESGDLVSELPPTIRLPVAYSEHGIIGNDSEAELAGLIAALVRQYGNGISIADLQAVVAHATTSGYPELFLEPKAAAKLQSLVSSMSALVAPTKLTQIPLFLHRLETCGAIRRRRNGPVTVFSPGVNPLPADVRSMPQHAELADLMLELNARRQFARSKDIGLGEHGERGTGTS